MGLTFAESKKKMALFTGTYENKVDKKGRVSLPAAYRQELQSITNLIERPIVHKQDLNINESDGANGEGASGTIFLYPSPTFKNVIEGCDLNFMNLLGIKLSQMSRFSAERNLIMDLYIAKAQRLTMDGQGRFMLPRDLAIYGKIDGQCLFIGKGDVFEIYNPADYESPEFKPAEPKLLEAAWLALEQGKVS